MTRYDNLEKMYKTMSIVVVWLRRRCQGRQ
jgi:hypothetical protein